MRCRSMAFELVVIDMEVGKTATNFFSFSAIASIIDLFVVAIIRDFGYIFTSNMSLSLLGFLAVGLSGVGPSSILTNGGVNLVLVLLSLLYLLCFFPSLLKSLRLAGGQWVGLVL